MVLPDAVESVEDGGVSYPETTSAIGGNPEAALPMGHYRELPADETCRLIDATLSRYRDSDRKVKHRLIMAIVISLILGFIGGHFWKGMVTKGNVTEISKPKVGKPGEHVKGYRP